MIRTLVSLTVITALYFACDSTRTASVKDSEQTGISEKSAEELLKEQDERTVPNAADQRYMESLTGAVAFHYEQNPSCGCGGAPAGHSDGLGLDSAGDFNVAEVCSIVNANSNNLVDGDGGCWLRANAVCLGALARGLDVAKVWIDGDVRFGNGQPWNFHVANVYDGKVFDAGWNMNGVSLEDWKNNFSGVNGMSPTQIHVTSCGSLYSQSGLFDTGFYSQNLLDDVCSSSEKFGGLTFAAQIDTWIREAAQNGAAGGVVHRGSGCSEGYADALAEQKISEDMDVPHFDDTSHLSSSCQEEIYRKAAPDYLQRGFRYVNFLIKPLSGGRVLASVVFRRYFIDARSVTAILSDAASCRVDVML